MQTNTNQNTPYRDRYRESCFKDAYGIKSEIEVTNFLDNQGNWKQAVLKFKHNGSIYGLIENFKQGADNSTDYVVLEGNGNEVDRSDCFVDMELKMVDIMRSK